MKKIFRKKQLLNKIIFVDGLPGCGKTMLLPILSSFKRVELVSYLFEVEFISRVYGFKKISKDALISLIRMFTDQKLYQTMMGRDTNFRFDDISSAFQNMDTNKYIQRLFQPGNETVPKKINKEKPILNIATHDVLKYSDIYFEALGTKLIFIEVVRHPLYMLIQQTLNMQNLVNNSRDIDVYYQYKNKTYPHYAKGWEEKFDKFNSAEKAIYYMHITSIKNYKIRKKNKSKKNFMTIPFERFVINPELYLNKILKVSQTKYSVHSKKILLESNIPRKKVADGVPLHIYKRCGWIAPIEGLTERDELDIRRNFAIKNLVSPKLMNILDKMSNKYEKNFWKVI